jgi:hypothetical protein
MDAVDELNHLLERMRMRQLEAERRERRLTMISAAATVVLCVVASIVAWAAARTVYDAVKLAVGL